MAQKTLPVASSWTGMRCTVQYNDANNNITSFTLQAGSVPAYIIVRDNTGAQIYRLDCAAGQAKTQNIANLKWQVNADGSLSYPTGYSVEFSG